jgi:hypothetical protein
LQLPPVATGDFQRFCELCTEIEALVIAKEGAAVEPLLAEWNAKANHEYRQADFTTYYGAVSKEEFVRQALSPRPQWIEDLTFDEGIEAVTALMSGDLPETPTSHVLGVLDVNLPESNLSDLLYWPNEWFGDEEMLDVDLTPAQVLEYAMTRAGRRLRGSPAAVDLPFPDPKRGRSR